jgi:nitrite reductase (NADH) small subunit
MKETTAWVRIARCSDIPLREGRAVKIGSREIAIFNLGDRFLALDNRCPHKGGPLADGIVSGASVVCPLHAWKFGLETGEGVNSASASHCIETVPTRVKDGVIFLELRDFSQTSQPELPAICMKAEIQAGTDLPLGP